MYSNMELDFDDGGEGEEEMVIHLTQASCKRTDNTNENKPKYENINQT